MASEAEIQHEQEHFDRAWHERERTRKSLQGTRGAAAGSRAASRAIGADAKQMLAKLGGADEAVAFGRFDDEDGESLYLGKHAITNEERDLLVINWQASAATPYFEATFDDPCGVVRRRKFDTERNTVRDFEEVVFTDLADSVSSLRESERVGIDDTVLRDLAQDRTGEMHDIVQTIHASQYELIRSPVDRLLVIQGGPGTGKTAVALHRVSWILFNHASDISAEDIMVVGPNPTFTRYIRKVLPGLGDKDVLHLDLRSFGPQPSTRRSEDAVVARLKGQERMATLLEVALAQRIRFPANQSTIEVPGAGASGRLERAEVEAQLERIKRSMRSYAAGRNTFRGWMANTVGSAGAPQQIDATVDRIWPSLTPQRFVAELFSSRERLLAAGGEIFTASDIQRLQRSTATRLSEETWADSDVALLDEADALITGSTPSFAHVVVDEAQDLSPMQLRSIRRRSSRGSMTVVGDIAQSTGPWARDSWDDVTRILQGDYPTQIDELTLGYRVPQQVYELAAQLLPEAAAQVTPPRVVRRGPADPDLREVSLNDCASEAVEAARDYAGRGLFVGIVSPELLHDDLLEALRLSGVAFTQASDGGLSTSINVVSPDEAKGLEFDAVVVLEPKQIVEEFERGLRTLYVALTRTTRFLTVVHSGVVLPLSGSAEPVAPLPPAVTDVEEPVKGFEVSDPPESKSRPAHPASAVERQSDLVSPAAVAANNSGPGDPRLDSGSTLTNGTGSAVSAPLDEMTRIMIQTMAAAMATSVRSAVAPPTWPHFVDELRRELGLGENATH